MKVLRSEMLPVRPPMNTGDLTKPHRVAIHLSARPTSTYLFANTIVGTVVTSSVRHIRASSFHSTRQPDSIPMVISLELVIHATNNTRNGTLPGVSDARIVMTQPAAMIPKATNRFLHNITATDIAECNLQRFQPLAGSLNSSNQ